MPIATNMVTVRYAVSDIDVAEAFYERLLGREPDVRMGEDFVEWEVVPGFWLQLQERLEAGHAGPLRFAVNDIEVARAFLDEAFGIEAGPAVRVDATLSTCDFFDPFGNPLGFLQVHEA